MDSDDVYESFSPPTMEESSPAPQKKFKRLAKQKEIQVPRSLTPPPRSIDPVIGLPGVDLPESKSLDDTAVKVPNSHFDDDSNESFPFQIESQMESEENESPPDMGFHHAEPIVEARKETRRVLEFGDPADTQTDENFGRLEKKRANEGDFSDSKDDEKEVDIGNKKKKTKRIKSDEKKSKPTAANKRSQEKERKAYLKQLHAESQRLLRETREAAFKPIPAVNKPISSVLEKIRQRKLELSKRNLPVNGDTIAVRDDLRGLESRGISMEQRKGGLTELIEEDTYLHPENVVVRNAEEKDSFTESASLSNYENTQMDESPIEEASPPMFRAPINDTEDLFANTETQDIIDELPVELKEILSDEVPKPSLLPMNLKLDSDPSEDSSSEEEDDDKENIDPLLHRRGDNSTYLRGAFAEAFLDDEAEVEDDSDNDLLCSKENEEEEDVEDSEELNDIIATDYSEKPVDHTTRNELHQRWLEQQDAAGTDNLLQKLKIGSKSEEDIFLGEEEEVSEDEEEYNYDDMAPKPSARMNSKKAKEMIAQMFVDKDDSFLSDEDEEVEKLRVKQQLLIRAEEQGTLISPMEDESSREVFGLIKKVNIVPENKKKAKATSFFDSVLKGGSNKSFSKPSFLSRLSNRNLPSSHKQGSGTVRSFIFGRDDSNSRSSILTSDDSSDTICKENQTVRTSVATFTSSQQAKLSSQYRSTSSVRGGASGASLFEILKRASVQPKSRGGGDNGGDPVDLTHVLATFKVPPKRQIKVNGSH